MSARFLLDTNALREPLRPSPNGRFLTRFEQHRASLAIAAPVWHEALFGLNRMPPGRKRDEVDDFLHNVIHPSIDILPYDAEAARWHAVERARLESEGRPVPFADGMVASVAARFGLTMVTHNVRDFERFSGISVVDWMSE
ncbi:MAG: type II toxin-antitoxin system VapC family toxin [Myxococcota bacterium]